MSRHHRAALVTVTVGQEYHQLARLTHGSFERYARRFGLDFVVINERTIRGEGTPHFEKLLCYDLLQGYDRLLFVDTDVLIAPDCPNLLEVVPQESFGASVVSNYEQYHDEAVALIQRLLRNIDWDREYFNTGVMVVARCHRHVFDAGDPDFDTWVRACTESPEVFRFFDQTYINFKVREQKIPVFDIGYSYNHTLASGNSAERFASHIIHCKGHRPGRKVDEVRMTRYVMERPQLRKWFVRYPALAAILDTKVPLPKLLQRQRS